MASEYQQSSPSSNMLNMSAAGPGTGFGGSSTTGSDFDFGTPQSMTIDTVMQGSDMGAPTNMQNYRPPPTNIPGSMGAFGAAYDPCVGRPAGTTKRTYASRFRLELTRWHFAYARSSPPTKVSAATVRSLRKTDTTASVAQTS